ncbi:lytic transglycosylase domain-containing protein [Azospirillum brasilense]|uniref:lytic transglycosylase domain-containing protein n=1 Tax=Azospirillum brasilense TaxID=192 RepID=UPI000E695C67|nr:lytic transglycosylase domain-containing protein [Azospirillum brasilense]NUB16057.1 lytic transglycosylase domain-containing protein [Azospirillum brasilense]NUB24939.1 lytic transglycosylase domain-containing protein [Azospirillum brasilense]NUB30864.1 lytic transglycosylase domain-containing protein [Azospirillum brasilense]RIW02197.1 lytic transglycosylase domain-containing protein [Azospirillum brasilense]
MKVALPPLAPIPERKPDVPAPLSSTGAASGGSFQSALADVQPVPRGRLANGQKVPPLPAAKPEAPIQLADGTRVPFPARKPEAVPGAVATAVAASGAQSTVIGAALANSPAAGQVVLAAQQVAGLSGHSFTAILAQATQESGLDPAARNRSSSAAGPFQFLERTWLDLFRRHGSAYGQGELAGAIQSRNGIPSVKDPAVRRQILALRHDVDLSAGMAARYLSEGRDRLEDRLKRPVSETESRIAYVLGVGGAAKLLRAAESSPRAAAAELLPAAARSNRGLFYDRASGRALTASETVARLTRRMDTDQKEMFERIAQAAEPRLRLDGGPSPLSSFQSAALGGTAGMDADGAGEYENGDGNPFG